MAEKDQEELKMNMGEVAMIRKILMGQQMENYESKFAELKREYDALQARLEDYARQSQDSLSLFETEAINRFEKLEHHVSEQVTMLQEMIDSKSKEDRHRIGALLKKIGSELLKD
jgi:hypothetical protein